MKVVALAHRNKIARESIKMWQTRVRRWYSSNSKRTHAAVAPPSTPSEIFLFLHKKTSAGFPPSKIVWTGFSLPKRRKNLGLNGGRRRWFVGIGIRRRQIVTVKLLGNLFQQGFRCGPRFFGVFSHYNRTKDPNSTLLNRQIEREKETIST